jgi:hypothetical protein
MDDLTERPKGQIPLAPWIEDDGRPVERWLRDRAGAWCNVDQRRSASLVRSRFEKTPEGACPGDMIVATVGRTHIIPASEVELLVSYPVDTVSGRQFWLWRQQEVQQAAMRYFQARPKHRPAEARGINDWNPHAT